MIFDAVGTLKGGAMITEKLIAADAEVREKLSLDSIPDARWKRTIGLALLLLCQRVPFARRWLCHLGLRTKPGWFARRIVEVPLPNGSHLKLASFGHNYLSFQLFWRGLNYYEPITRMICEELLQPGDTLIDCGAQVGFFSLVSALIKPGISVVAFEPQPENFRLLVGNVLVNGLNNIRCEPIAISDTNGFASFYLADSDMSASLLPNFERDIHATIEVATTTIDSYVETHPPRGHLLIKVDVEGAEERFFAGARRTMGIYRPDIICEVAIPISPHSVAFAKDLGYRFYQIADDGLVQSPTLVPNIRGDLLFLNYLLSPRPPEQLAQLFDRIRPKVRDIDLRQTSKFVCPAHIERAQRQLPAPH
jgi:FkbM family methyltransferase